jgi:hypothetical protein
MGEPAVSDAPDDSAELTPDERAELRRLLRLLRRASVDARKPARVERSPKIDVAAYVSQRRRRKGMRDG